MFFCVTNKISWLWNHNSVKSFYELHRPVRLAMLHMR